jgi:hypothetical protein
VVPGYTERIPSVLLMMERFLKAHNGRDQVGIFRLAPDAEDCAFVKKQINAGEFKTIDDVNVIANLIKVMSSWNLMIILMILVFICSK